LFLPTTLEEVQRLGWDGLDVVLVTGDSYIDSPFIGAALIGKVLVRAGYRTSIVHRTSPAWANRGSSGA
jgi:hypothetical protein